MTNVVLVHTDDTGQYIQPYGYPVETPNLQALSAEGVTFRNAFCASPKCSPSRAAMLTGEFPHTNGMYGISHLGFELNDPDHHLANVLAREGYETALCGQQHEASSEGGRHDAAVDVLGYTTIPPHPDPDEGSADLIDHDRTRRDHAIAEAAAAFVREDHDDPYFLSVGLWNTHRPFPGPETHDIDPDTVRPPAPMPDTPELREQMAGYHALAREVDACVGTILNALRESGDIDDTLVLFTSDHGLPFAGMKDSLYDGGIGVPLLARFPEGWGRGETVDELVSHLDLFPTLCEYLDVPRPPWLTGRSVLPVVRDGAAGVRDAVFAEHHFPDFYDPKRCVRTDRYKLIRFYPVRGESESAIPEPPKPNAPPDDEFDWSDTSQRAAIERGIHHPARTDEVLFDLYYDPTERVNVADDPTYGAVRNRLATRLDEWMERTDDPLRNGPIPLPEDAEYGVPERWRTAVDDSSR